MQWIILDTVKVGSWSKTSRSVFTRKPRLHSGELHTGMANVLDGSTYRLLAGCSHLLYVLTSMYHQIEKMKKRLK